ncbi:MAG: hypothetical protein EA402_12855 [Planctomycetota bacterium]|nr:MAG: hypothetical protein EA402_12855 [Planctomycetota bacterium]
MTLTRLMVAALVLGGALAASPMPSLGAAEEEPMLHASLPDFQITRARLEQGLWGKLWRSDALASLREELSQEFTQMAEEEFDPRAIYTGLGGGRLILHGLDDHPMMNPRFALRVDFGTAMNALWQFMGREFDPAPLIHGAEAALTEPDGEVLYLRHGQQLSILRQGIGIIESLAPAEGAADHDLIIHINPQLLLNFIPKDELEDEQVQQLKKVLDLSDKMVWTLRLLDDGVSERLVTHVQPGTMSGISVPEVDFAAVDRLPAESLMLLAFAWNTSAYKDTSWYLTREEFERSTDLADFGLGFLQPLISPISDLYYAIEGTVVVAVLPGEPLPAIALQLPINDQSQAAVAQLLAPLAQELPEVGSQIQIDALPGMPIFLARSQAALFITSHPTAAQSWLAGEGGALNATAAKAATAAQRDGAAINAWGFSDTPRLLQTAQNLLPLAGMWLGGGGEEMAQLQTSLELIGQEVGTGFLLIDTLGDESRAELKSMSGTLSGFFLFGWYAFATTFSSSMPADFDNIDDWEEWED